MPKSLDLVLGISAVMLLLSLAVTALTQYLVGLANLRGRHLRTGLATLVMRLDPSIAERHAVALATAILQDPSLCDAAGRLGSFLHRAQFTGLCLSLAVKEGKGPHQALRELLAARGIADPTGTLNRIARCALELEQAHPGLSETARLEMAVAETAASPFVACIHAAFDQTMDRVSARFTSSVRAVTVAVALALAGFLRIDCLELIGQFTGWRWSANGGAARAAGILLTAMLLSLGAPFWFHLLSGAIRLRPPMAREVRGPAPTFSRASSARLPESDEWRPIPASRYSAGRR